jgi:S-DNA-T family DNA segregation ATPase FtsK/SpoIIIE
MNLPTNFIPATIVSSMKYSKLAFLLTISTLIFFFSLLGLSSEGALGLSLNRFLTDIITPIGTFFVYLAGIFVGLVVLFDTSVDELMALLGSIGEVIQKWQP